MNSEILGRAALDYAARFGFAVLPCKSRGKVPLAETHGCKSATKDPAQIQKWWERYPEANVAIATGAASGIVVLDVDPRHGGDKSLAELERRYGPLPQGPRVQTSGGGLHIYFKNPGRVIRNSAGAIGKGLDIRGDGGHVIAPPSIHSSGELYKWKPGSRIGDSKLPEIPGWLLELMANENRNKPSALTPSEEILEGSRNTKLYRLARSLHARGRAPGDVLAALRDANRRLCRPALHDDEVVQIASNAVTQPDSLDFNRQSADDIPRLAGLSPLEYDRVRGPEAKRLGVRIQTLDTEVEKARSANRSAPAQPSIVPPPPEPWHEPVVGLELLDQLRSYLSRFVVVGDHATIALTLWIVFTYLLDIVEVSPRLAILSPAKRCGKSTVLGLLMALARRPLSASNISGSAVFRTLDAERPTLLIDEADTFASDNNELRGILNSGHQLQTAFVIRSVKVVDDWLPKRFSTLGAIAVAGIGRLPDTWIDRSIVIQMNRKPSALVVEKLLRRNTAAIAEAMDLSRKIARWTADRQEDLRAAAPDMPRTLDDRATDNWELLIAIADVVGGGWPALARQAAVALSSDRDEAASIQELLLADIRQIFEDDGKKADRLFSAAICAALGVMETRPWPEFGKRRKPITPTQLARQLGPFGVTPRTIRIGTETAKGYRLSDLASSFAMYTSARTVTPSQHNAELARARAHSVTGTAASLQGNEKNTHSENGRGVMTDRNVPADRAG